MVQFRVNHQQGASFMETRTSHSVRVLGVSLAAASVALTALVAVASGGAAAAVVPVAFGLPFVAVVVLDGIVSHREHHA
jgi:hypothetical protein